LVNTFSNRQASEESLTYEKNGPKESRSSSKVMDFLLSGKPFAVM
jgi:hypothetical protein